MRWSGRRWRPRGAYNGRSLRFPQILSAHQGKPQHGLCEPSRADVPDQNPSIVGYGQPIARRGDGNALIGRQTHTEAPTAHGDRAELHPIAKAVDSETIEPDRDQPLVIGGDNKLDYSSADVAPLKAKLHKRRRLAHPPDLPNRAVRETEQRTIGAKHHAVQTIAPRDRQSLD